MTLPPKGRTGAVAVPGSRRASPTALNSAPPDRLPEDFIHELERRHVFPLGSFRQPPVDIDRRSNLEGSVVQGPILDFHEESSWHGGAIRLRGRGVVIKCGHGNRRIIDPLKPANLHESPY